MWQIYHLNWAQFRRQHSACLLKIIPISAAWCLPILVLRFTSRIIAMTRWCAIVVIFLHVVNPESGNSNAVRIVHQNAKSVLIKINFDIRIAHFGENVMHFVCPSPQRRTQYSDTVWKMARYLSIDFASFPSWLRRAEKIFYWIIVAALIAAAHDFHFIGGADGTPVLNGRRLNWRRCSAQNTAAANCAVVWTILHAFDNVKRIRTKYAILHAVKMPFIMAYLLIKFSNCINCTTVIRSNDAVPMPGLALDTYSASLDHSLSRDIEFCADFCTAEGLQWEKFVFFLFICDCTRRHAKIV